MDLIPSPMSYFFVFIHTSDLIHFDFIFFFGIVWKNVIKDFLKFVEIFKQIKVDSTGP